MRTFLAAIMLVGCSAEGELSKPPEYDGDHPIDEVLHPRFVAEKIDPQEAPRAEICRRMFADLIGRFPTKDEIASDCEGRSIEAIAEDLQSRPEYLLVSERHWRDRRSPGETF